MPQTYTGKISSLTQTMGWTYVTEDIEASETTPKYTGTIKAIVKEIQNDEDYQKKLVYPHRVVWFFRGAEIIGLDAETHEASTPEAIDFMIRCLNRDRVTAILASEPCGCGIGRQPLDVSVKKVRLAVTLSPRAMTHVKVHDNQSAYVESLILADMIRN